MKQGLITALQWHDDNTCSLLTYHNDYNRIPLTQGENLSFTVTPGRHCIGYTALTNKQGTKVDSWRTHKPCPDDAQITSGRQCRSCSMMDIMNPCLRCDGSTCSAHPTVMKACEENEANVYLAAFKGGRIKAGVSRAQRVRKRWIEQGADIARRVLKGNGYKVRQYEQAIQRQLGLLNHVQATSKRTPLTNTEEAIRQLDHFEEKVHEMYPPETHIHEPPQNLAPIYNLPLFKSAPLQLRVKDGLQVSGRVLGVKGPVLYIEMGDLTYTLNLSRLIGRRIEPLEAKIRSQSSIDRYFR